MIIQSQAGEKVYSDGDITEHEMLKIAQKYPGELSQDYISNNSKYTINNTFSPVRQNILNWYNFKEDATILEVGAGMGALTGLFCDRCAKVTAIEMNEVRAEVIRERYRDRKNLTVLCQNINTWENIEKYDYVVFVGVLEYAAIFQNTKTPHYDFLENVRRFLKSDGVLLFAIENRFGLKYWSGAAEDHLCKPYVGIEGYKEHGTAVTFSKQELINLLKSTGLIYNRFYYVLPDYKFPQLIFSDDYKPNGHELSNVHFTYGANSNLLFDERKLYEDIVENNVADFFANSYLVEASLTELSRNHTVYVSARSECKKKYRIITQITSSGMVTKKAVNREALGHIQQLYNNTLFLKNRGIRVLSLDFRDDHVSCKVYKGIKADEKFVHYLKQNDFLSMCKMIDRLKNAILKSAPYTTKENILLKYNLCSKVDATDIVLEKGFIDMTFYNAFIEDDNLIFFDQEWCVENVPVSFILYYAIKNVYKFGKNNTDIKFSQLCQYAGIKVPYEIYDKLEVIIWDRVLQRTGDIYGADGYCNQYKRELTLDYKLDKLDDKINNLNGEIDRLMSEKAESERAINEIRSSRAWRLMQKIWLVRDKVIPLHSKRRLLLKLFYCTMHNPKIILSKFTINNMRKLLYYIRYDSLENHIYFNSSVTNKYKITKVNLKLFPIAESDRSISVYEKLEFPKFENIKVSIIIPVYNQFGYTYNCLRSILQNTGLDIPYEVIVADDNSTDLTQMIDSILFNVRVIHNHPNLQFIRNCNQAVDFVRGEKIFFLNNDTQVQPGWLAGLIELMDRDRQIGMVGSKLVYPTGELQEAGGIVWRDGTAWNYGRYEDSNLPQFNYVKEVDYISGAAIMIRRKLWQEIGGFDEQFIPAYCEDTDLAFEVRKRGFKVVYQPKSVVVHFEGMSNGKNTDQGIKHYQIENQKKFYQKWKVQLRNFHQRNAVNVFQARDRSMGKKTILLMCHDNTIEKDTLQLLPRLGYNVKLWINEGQAKDCIKDNVRQTGIEVLIGNKDYIYNWLQKNKKYIDVVFWIEENVSKEKLAFFRKKIHAKFIGYSDKSDECNDCFDDVVVLDEMNKISEEQKVTLWEKYFS
ncbi:glycosyltransferase [Pectinatus haikarae]|uniref:glycosyltransferase n=1 Tax=Pectinatus haikarae TaxID=349096 RepID=UPI0018C4E0BD|nr:glycosyltransferase [Pectinatus haikarae]